MSKGDSIITFTLLVNTLLFTAVVQAVHGLIWFHQYSSSVVAFSVLQTVGLLHSSPLWVAFFPILIDFLRAKVIATVKKAN